MKNYSMHTVTCYVFKKMVSLANSSRPHNLFIDKRSWRDEFLDYAQGIISTDSCSGYNRVVIIPLTVCVMTGGIVASVDVVLSIFSQNIYLAH